jgi:hypothetical protein
MKRLKSKAKDLRDLFERSISAQHIAEHLLWFDEGADASRVGSIMDSCGFDVVGVGRNGLVDGYVEKTGLNHGTLKDHRKGIPPSAIIEATENLLVTLTRLCDSERVFVGVPGRVRSIVTRGDLQKAPVRMWLFGLITLVEMQLLRIIRGHFPEDTWREYICEDRWLKAEQEREQRKRKNEGIDTADCLQFWDKSVIIGRTPDIWQKLGYKSPGDWNKDLQALGELRNNLAHAQSITSGSWGELMQLAKKAEDLLGKCEEQRV